MNEMILNYICIFQNVGKVQRNLPLLTLLEMDYIVLWFFLRQM